MSFRLFSKSLAANLEHAPASVVPFFRVLCKSISELLRDGVPFLLQVGGDMRTLDWEQEKEDFALAAVVRS